MVDFLACHFFSFHFHLAKKKGTKIDKRKIQKFKNIKVKKVMGHD